jgi:glycosyltransferase involved in cell wall biosynthesis
MSTRSLVSAIIIFLSEEKFLSEAIESVFAQTYDNWELLLVDDGSSDGSTEIARRYAEQHPRKVRYLEHESHRHRGTGASRNLGIRHATGAFIAFLDADDVWLSHKLARQVAIMGSRPEAAMVYGSPELWHSWTGRSEDRQRDSLQAITVEPNTIVGPPTLLALFLARKAITPAPSDALLRREIVDDVGGFEETFKTLYEDQAFFTKVCLKASIFVSGECWDRHRQHRDSICSVGKKTGEYYSARPVYLNWVERYLTGQKVEAAEAWKALQKELWLYRHPIFYSLLRRKQRYTRLVGETVKQIAWRMLPVPVRRWLLAHIIHQPTSASG